MATANCIINIAWADKPIAESTLIETVNVSELNIEEHNIGEDFETVPSVKDEFTEITEELKTHTELADALKEAINHCKKSQETFKYKREYAFDLKQHHDSRFNNIRFRGFQNLISDIIDKAKHSVKIFGCTSGFDAPLKGFPRISTVLRTVRQEAYADCDRKHPTGYYQGLL